MDREEIKKILPHREPMLLLDRGELTIGEDGIYYSEASYFVRGDEFFLQGHFPDNPVVPGVILCEMMGQSACALVAGKIEGATPYFTGIDNVKFRSRVLPGDTVVFKTSLKKSRPPFFFVSGEGRVDGKLCISGELSFALVK